MTNPTGDALKASADEPIAWYLNMWNEGDEDVRSEIYWGRPSGDAIQWAEHNGHDIEHLYARPAALSVEQAPQPVAGEAHVLGYISQNSLDLMHGKIKAHAKIYPKQDSTASIPVYINTPTEAPPVESQAAEPDYCFDPEEWEFTCHWSDRDEVHGHGESLNRRDPMRVCTLMKGKDKWVADVPITWDENGDPDDTEIKWFDSEEEALAALAAEGSAE